MAPPSEFFYAIFFTEIQFSKKRNKVSMETTWKKDAKFHEKRTEISRLLKRIMAKYLNKPHTVLEIHVKWL